MLHARVQGATLKGWAVTACARKCGVAAVRPHGWPRHPSGGSLCATHRAPRTPPSTSTSACATFIHGADARSCLPPVWQTAVLVKEETISGLVQGTEGDVVSGLLRTLAGNAAVRRRICDSFKFKLRKRGDKSDIGGDSAAGQHAGWRWGVECVTSRDGLCACSVRFQAHAVQQGAPGAHWSVHVCVMSVCRVAYAVWLMRAVWAVRAVHLATFAALLVVYAACVRLLQVVAHPMFCALCGARPLLFARATLCAEDLCCYPCLVVRYLPFSSVRGRR